ncbi:MAG: PSD1 and planctomycete cytochrome C domain-containing protein [Planctomycetaceae bacterium]
MRISVVFLLIASVAGADEPVDFSRQILPILSNKCFVCHGPDTNDETDLRLDTPEGATGDRGGYRAVDASDPAASAILKRIHDEDDPMPPVEAERQLTANEKELLSRWIYEGGNYAKHWAFVAPRKQALPDPTDNPIDSFIGEQLTTADVSFADEGDRPTLARRAALILTGLPPEPDQLERFLADETPEAWNRFVSELLNSTRYGEHQARYWLDAVRYGDTHGLHLDNRRGIYPYRDWVVRALNTNLPLDQFITWQLAGDLLNNPSMDQLIATGYVRMNPTTAEGGVLPEEFQAKNNFDRTENLGTVFLGMSLTCARCHTHKYDPIPQREYYQLLAFFNSTAEPPLDSNAYEFGPTLKVPRDQQSWEAWQQLGDERRRLVKKLQDGISELQISAEDRARWQASSDETRLELLASVDGPFSSLPGSTEARDLARRIAAAAESFTTTLIASEREQARETRVLQRGEYDLPTGDVLTPGVLAVMGQLPADAPANRLGLARWLTSKEHPLLSRVLINRIWQRTFGHGLVRTPEDFGLQGQQPTHPALLDWLAVELQDSGWDLKHMLRLMVTNRTFRQSSAFRKDINDPENRLWARGPGFRLDAEALRDLGLWSADLLDPHMGGEGVKPYQPAGMWKAMAHPASNTKEYVRDEGPEVYRRSLYVYWKRTSPHPMMTLFDAPDRESSCVRRGRTSTPLQSLGLLNEIQRVEMGKGLAHRLIGHSDDDNSRLTFLFTLLASRDPSPAEREACLQLVQKMRRRYANVPADAAALLATSDSSGAASAEQIEMAAWTQLAITALASDIAVMVY